MRTAHARLNSWNTSNTSFQNADNRPVTAQKVVEHRQESYRNARLRRVKSAVGSQRALNPNVERILNSSKRKIKGAKPTRHFKAWNDREVGPSQKEKIYRKEDLKSRLPTRNVGAKKAVESFASSLRGGSVREKKRRYSRSSTNGGRGASLRSRNRATVDRSKRSAKAREALIAQKRMRKAKAAALKAKQMERQMQHVRRIKRLDTTIRPVLGNRTNQLPSRLDMEVERASKLGKDKTEISGEDILYGNGMSFDDLGKVCEDSGTIDNSSESFESNSYTKYDEGV